MKDILAAIEAERTKQDAKWGAQNHNLVEWIAILTEEIGEASKEAVDYHFVNKPKDRNIEFNTLEFEELQQERLECYRKELIQAAAVIVAMIQSVDRNEMAIIMRNPF